MKESGPHRKRKSETNEAESLEARGAWSEACNKRNKPRSRSTRRHLIRNKEMRERRRGVRTETPNSRSGKHHMAALSHFPRWPGHSAPPSNGHLLRKPEFNLRSKALVRRVLNKYFDNNLIMNTIILGFRDDILAYINILKQFIITTNSD